MFRIQKQVPLAGNQHGGDAEHGCSIVLEPFVAELAEDLRISRE